MKTKICSKCKKRKPLKKFGVNRAKKDGLNHQCKQCRKEYSKEHYKANAEKLKEKGKEYYKANSEKIMEQKKERYKTNPEIKQNALKWQAANPEKVKQSANKSWAKKKQTFWGYWNNRFSSLIRELIKGIIKISPTLENALGCPSQQFVDHIISQLKPGMSLANYGTKWEIDHIMAKALLPYDSFDDPNFKKLWCLENLRPLWKADNQKKGTKAA